jgi:hypothetical protein
MTTSVPDDDAVFQAANRWLDDFLKEIKSGQFLSEALYTGLDADAALDARDHDAAFEREWLRLSDAVEAEAARNPASMRVQKTISDIRKQSFLCVSRATSQHDIAGYVSDDLALLAQARVFGVFDDPFAQRLWAAYRAGRFPVPDSR